MTAFFVIFDRNTFTMKTLVFTFLALAISTQLFATHYHQNGNTSESRSLYYVQDGVLMKATIQAPKGYYEFYSDCSGLKNEESGLTKTGLSEYLSESGKTHKIADLFRTYENRAKLSREDVNITSQHDSDVICVLKKTGEKFTVDIYTGKDAKSYLELHK